MPGVLDVLDGRNCVIAARRSGGGQDKISFSLIGLRPRPPPLHTCTAICAWLRLHSRACRWLDLFLLAHALGAAATELASTGQL